MIKNRILLVFLLIGFISCNQVFARRSVSSSPQKKCFSNMRFLLGAVEMYNMDNEEMLHEINEDVIELLKKGKYLKNDLYCPHSNKPGHYHNHGDLCEDGVIYCDYHGSVDGYGNEKGQIVPASREYQLEERRKELERKLDYLMPFLFVIALIAIVWAALPTKKKRK